MLEYEVKEFIFEVPEVIEVQEEVSKELLKAKVIKITELGELKIRFSTFMKTDLMDIGSINSTIIDLYIIPSENREDY